MNYQIFYKKTLKIMIILNNKIAYKLHKNVVQKNNQYIYT